MQAVALSDTHNRHNSVVVPDGDILLFAGDALGRGSGREFRKFADWWNELPHKYKIFVPGNHDFACETQPGPCEDMLNEVSTTHFLIDEGVTIEGRTIWGSPYTPWFYDWAFNVPRGTLTPLHWHKIPKDLDVLITHGPPGAVLDQAVPGKTDHLGDSELTDLIVHHKIEPKHHIFGHIHGSYGFHVDPLLPKTMFHNVAICDEAYQPVNACQVFEI
jgi:hypothetical protein